MATLPDVPSRQLQRPWPRAPAVPDLPVRQLQRPGPQAATRLAVSLWQLQRQRLRTAPFPDVPVLRSGQPALNLEAGQIPIRPPRPIGELRVLSDRNWPPK